MDPPRLQCPPGVGHESFLMPPECHPTTAATSRRSSLQTDGRRSPPSDVSGDPPPTTDAADPPATAVSPAATGDAPSNPEDMSKPFPNGSTLPSPYGTRSRNRTGNARPNYAEDRDGEMDYEWTSAKKSRRPSDPDAAPTGNGRRATAGAAASGTIRAVASPAAAKENVIPGTSSFSLAAGASTTPPPAASKKRKAPGGGAQGAGCTPQPANARKPNAVPPSAGLPRESNMVSFETCRGHLSRGGLVADDKTAYRVNDTVYLVSEPPGEPYYLARIMEFLHAGNDPDAPVDAIRINWIYRPRDINRKATDTRLVFASMHSDTCPLTSLRGRCEVQHRSKISDLDRYRKGKDRFYYAQMFDRYMKRYYDVVPTSQVINVPERAKAVLDQRWQYVVVEAGRAKELTSAIKTCKRCVGYCASHDSVDCAVCKNTYHMNCVQPPLLKKPARGFAWSCGPCSRRQEKKLEARNTAIVEEVRGSGDDREEEEEEEEVEGGEGEDGGEEILDEEQEGEEEEEEVEDRRPSSNPTSRNSPANSDGDVHAATKDHLAQAKLWPYRYLGIHCKVEDVLDYDDRIYPRARSRLGPRHQANVLVWHGHPLEYVKPADIKKKYGRGGTHRRDAKPSRDPVAAVDPDRLAKGKRPKWVMDEPPGFVHRGGDRPNADPLNTARVCFRLPRVGESPSSGRGEEDGAGGGDTDPGDRERTIDDYMTRAGKVASALGVPAYHTNFLDKALECLYGNGFDAGAALEQLQGIDVRKDLREPRLNKEELRRFEEGVERYGSSLQDISRHVGRVKHGDIVRFYYTWKKTERGKQIWGGFEGRKSKKQAKQVDGTPADDVADDQDDSAFDNDKAARRRRGFECKFCLARQSRFWRRAPGTAPGTTVPADPGAKSGRDKGAHLTVALCQRCAGLWRRYAIQWEDIDEVAKRVSQSGGRAFKRKMDEELLIELVSANEASSVGMSAAAVAVAASLGVEVPPALTIRPEEEGGGGRKRLKAAAAGAEKEKEVPPPAPPVPAEPAKKKAAERPPEPPLVPEPPRPKALPCMVCMDVEPPAEERFCCRHCRLTVHRNCYGIAEGRSAAKWICDTCTNDMTGQYSTSYRCVLCPVRYNEFELFEPPKTSHKKKTDREREKERLEKEMVAEATAQYQRKQEDMGWPKFPREALKPTANNNWVHVACAVWTPAIRFRTPRALEVAEGSTSIPIWRYQQACKLCRTSTGACVTCHRCPATFHVTCAQQYAYPMGFDVTPVKGSRKDAVSTITLGEETGSAEAIICCRDHSTKSVVHPMNQPVDAGGGGLNALQLFVRTFKQADVSLTGTARKAASMMSSGARPTGPGSASGAGRRGSQAGGGNGAAAALPSAPVTRASRASPVEATVKSEEVGEDGDRIVHLSSTTAVERASKECAVCKATASPKWHERPTGPERHGPPNGHGEERPAIGIGNPVEGRGPDRGAAAGSAGETTMARVEYVCHRCHVRRLKGPPTPPKVAQPVVELQRSAVVEELAPAWPAGPHPPMPPRLDVRPVRSPAAPVPPSANGTHHHASPPQYVSAHAPPAYAAALLPHAYANGLDRRDPPIGTRSPSQPDGVVPQYAMSRPPGPYDQALYAGAHRGSPPYGTPRTNGLSYGGGGPSGLPRAAENPFMPAPAHLSPGQQYRATAQGSPRFGGERQRTPGEGYARNGNNGTTTTTTTTTTGVEGQLVNGASASPSLRNLLH